MGVGMIELGRYKGFLCVTAGVLCAVLLCNAGLVWVLGDAPDVFDNPDRKLAWSQLERVGAQVAGVELEMRRGGLGDQPAFGVVLGQSTTLRGIDPTALGEQMGPGTRWLLVNGFGSSFVKLNYYAQTLFASKLRPGVVVLGLHETMLAGQDRGNKPRGSGGVDEDAQRQKRKMGLGRRIRHLLNARWTRKQRANIYHFTSMNLFELRLAMHSGLGLGALGLFTPSDRPWRASARAELPNRHEGRMKRQRKGWQDFGWFEAGTYDRTNQQADAFRDLIAGCGGMGDPEIVIVLLPITSELRGWLPVEAGEQTMLLIDEVSVRRSVRVIDLRDAMPDSAFADYAHLNPSGREVFTRMLAERLTETDRAD